MDNFKSYEFTFLYLINKCILLFKYIDNIYQKEILYDIKIFINKLQELFSKADFKNSEDKKNKILEILITYFEKIIDEKIYNLINSDERDNIIVEVEKNALNICEHNEKNNNKSEKPILKNYNDYIVKDTYKEDKEDKENNKNIFKEKISKEVNKNNYSQISLIEFEQKINNKIKTIFSEIENNIKISLKDYFDHTKYVEYDLDKKFNAKLESNNILVETKIRELFNNLLDNDNFKDSLFSNNILVDYINKLIKYQINDIYSYVDTIKSTLKNNSYYSDYGKDTTLENLNNNLKKDINDELENKIRLLGNIFNENIEKIFNNLNNKIIENEKELLILFEEKINNSNFNKYNFNILFDKDLNTVQLFYCDEVIATTKINIKGLIGPKGPDGKKGDSGETPIIRKIKVTDDKKFKFIIQEGTNLYEVISDDTIPNGPQGIRGEKGEPGKSVLDLKWNQENVMRVDNENNDSLIFTKSLCIGEKSHCIKDNSLSIAGGRCYQNNSIALGNNAKTLDSESIAFYGTCIGKKSFSYRADNVDENCVDFGKKEKNNYNINSYNINSKEINIECDSFKIKANKYENNKIKELEDRVIFLEKKIVDILKKI
jgi:hypothetical protein